MALTLVGATLLLVFEAGGFFDQPRTTLAIAAWVLVGIVGVARPAWLLPPTRPGRWAVAGLLGLAAWTALSLLWAPLYESARGDAVRLALYAAVLPLACAAFAPRRVARLLEPALAGVALVAVGYALLGELGLLDLDASLGAAGRLEQPLSYWNAMGALAALGLVLCLRIASDGARPAPLRVAAALAAPALAIGLYLTYSRGALVAALLGLLVLILLAPEAAPLWRRAGRRSRELAVGLAVLVVLSGLVAVAGDRGEPARGATPARFADLGSNRADYWRVALGSFAAAPLGGVGSSGFRVEWLRDRDVREGAADAHSLPIETAAELGLIGLLLLAGFAGGVAACAVGVARRDAAFAAGPCAALTVLAFHASIDWDWELPALSICALLLAGALIARDGRVAA